MFQHGINGMGIVQAELISFFALRGLTGPNRFGANLVQA